MQYSGGLFSQHPVPLVSCRPGDARLFRSYGCQSFIQEPLQSPALIRFDCVKVVLRVQRDVVQRIPLTGIVSAFTERREFSHARAVEDADFLITTVCDI